MNITCGRSPFTRNSVCPKARRKTLVAIALIYAGAAVIAFITFKSRVAQAANDSSNDSSTKAAATTPAN